MFTTIFVNAILGHMVGDYLLQNQWMALNKARPGRLGHVSCSVHVALYTLAVALFSGIFSPTFLALVALPHWLIDRYSLAWPFLRLKNFGKEPRELDQVWPIAFAAPVYIATDNTFHFVCLWSTLKLIGA